MAGWISAARQTWHGIVCTAMVCGISAASWGVAGCRKSETEAHPAGVPTTPVALFASDIKPDGSILPTGLAKVKATADAAHVTVTFSRVQVGDPALAQLAQFPNVKRIEAYGSQITAAGVEKLKQSSPGIDVGF